MHAAQNFPHECFERQYSSTARSPASASASSRDFMLLNETAFSELFKE